MFWQFLGWGGPVGIAFGGAWGPLAPGGSLVVILGGLLDSRGVIFLGSGACDLLVTPFSGLVGPPRPVCQELVLWGSSAVIFRKVVGS